MSSRVLDKFADRLSVRIEIQDLHEYEEALHRTAAHAKNAERQLLTRVLPAYKALDEDDTGIGVEESFVVSMFLSEKEIRAILTKLSALREIEVALRNDFEDGIGVRTDIDDEGKIARYVEMVAPNILNVRAIDQTKAEVEETQVPFQKAVYNALAQTRTVEGTLLWSDLTTGFRNVVEQIEKLQQAVAEAREILAREGVVRIGG